MMEQTSEIVNKIVCQVTFPCQRKMQPDYPRVAKPCTLRMSWRAASHPHAPWAHGSKVMETQHFVGLVRVGAGLDMVSLGFVAVRSGMVQATPLLAPKLLRMLA